MFRFFRFNFLSCLLLLLPLASLPANSAPGAAPKILVFGDSLSAAYGIPKEQGWVSLLRQQLKEQSLNHQVINASISGETTSGGITRLKKLLNQHQPDFVVIQLGANDGLRGLPITEMRRNLTAMIELCQQSGAKVSLLGIMIPPNYGPRYTQEFRETYTLLAQQYKLPLVPFLLEGVAGNVEFMQEDGLHPTSTAQPIVLDNVWKMLAPQLKSFTAKR